MLIFCLKSVFYQVEGYPNTFLGGGWAVGAGSERELVLCVGMCRNSVGKSLSKQSVKVAVHLSFQGSVVAAAVAAALASSSVLEIVSVDGAIRHRHGRAIALSRGRKARHPTPLR